MKYTRYIFKGCGAPFTVYNHNKKVGSEEDLFLWLIIIPNLIPPKREHL